MRRALVLVVSVILLLLSVVPVASANNDRHRFFLPSGSFDLAAQPDGPCAFVVHFDTLVNKESGKLATLVDGSTRFTFTGSMKVRLSANGKSVDLNVSGPGRILYAPDGSTWSWRFEGRTLTLNPGLSALGFPSDLVLVSGLYDGTAAAADNWAGAEITSVSHMPHVDLDVCAALS
jgi:hypothetical protein